MKQYFITYSLLLICFATYAQYNTEGELENYYYENNPQKLFPIDTSLKNFEEYNLENKDDWDYFNIGIIGSAQQKLSFDWNRRRGFKDGNNFFEQYKYDFSKIKRYNTTKFPYSEISYSIGSSIEQVVALKHAQNIQNRFNYALDVYGISSNGTYKETERTRNAGLSFYGIYNSKNNRYHLAADFTYSTIKTSENGGISEDVLVDIRESKLFYNTNILNAITEQNTLNFALKNSYDFGFYKLDSISDTLKVKKFYPKYRIKHSIGTNVTRNMFIGKGISDSLSYQQFYQIPDSTYSKMAYHNVTHRIAFEYLGTKNGDSVSYKNLQWEVSLQHNNIEVWHNGFEQSRNDLKIEGVIRSNSYSGSKFNYYLNVASVLTGNNRLEIYSKAQLGYNLKKFGLVSASVSYEDINPSWIETHFVSSSEKWNNSNFLNKQNISGNLTYKLEKYKLKIEGNFDFLSNYIYFNESSTPIQTDAKIAYWNVSIKKDTKWKIWHWNNFIGFQTSNHSEILPLPNLFLKTSIYAKFKMFKSNLLLMPGIDLRYNSNFNARAWNPLIAQFYTQDNETMNYTPIMDVFINAQIKTVRIYAKVNYVNEGLFVQNVYKALHYPSNGRTFSFGVSWRFFE